MNRKLNQPLHRELVERIGCKPDVIEVLDCGEGIGNRVALIYYEHDHRVIGNDRYLKQKAKSNSRCMVCHKLIAPQSNYCTRHARRGNSKEGA